MSKIGVARRCRWAAAAIAIIALAGAPGVAHGAVSLDWTDCGDGYQCATATVPLDYGNPSGATIELNVSRLPHTGAKNLGPLFINFGGPGDSTAETFRGFGAELFASLRENFDIMAVDPRGTGPNGLDCKVDQETQGLYAHPFWTPDNTTSAGVLGRANRLVRRCNALNSALLPYVTTANVARDIDGIRAAVAGSGKLNYFGFSYGTFLGQTYATLFPSHYRSMVLDGPLDPDQYINRPSENLFAQSAGFERGIGRFFQACAAHKDACPFDADDPWAAFDQLAEAADVKPIPVPGSSRRINGDQMRAAIVQAVYAKQLWPLLADALADAEHGDAGLFALLVDFFYARNDDGTFDPITDRYFLIGAVEQKYPSDPQFFFDRGLESYNLFDHSWWNAGYVELPLGLLGVSPVGVFRGPFGVPSSAPWILFVGTTYDPATPYRGAKAAVKAFSPRARLLTMRGDGHTAYGGNSACIDQAVDAYLIQLKLPSKGATCQQEVPFGGEEASAQKVSAAETAKRTFARPHMKVLSP